MENDGIETDTAGGEAAGKAPADATERIVATGMVDLPDLDKLSPFNAPNCKPPNVSALVDFEDDAPEDELRRRMDREMIRFRTEAHTRMLDAERRDIETREKALEIKRRLMVHGVEAIDTLRNIMADYDEDTAHRIKAAEIIVAHGYFKQVNRNGTM